MKKEIAIIIGFILVALAIWFKPQPKIIIPPLAGDKAIIDLSDREHGICAPMYKEGFDWGVGQDKINWATDNMRWNAMKMTRLERALDWYEEFETAYK